MSILTTDDFGDGRYTIAKDSDQTADLQIYIDYVENYYLKRMFGVELDALFQADLILGSGVPTEARFTYIFNAFDYQDTNSMIYSSGGIKELLKGLTYFYYLRDLNKKVAPTGTIITKSANSENISSNWVGVQSRYNESVETLRIIQAYMDYLKPVDYPEYDGVIVLKVNPF
jgi:hypothetical protein